MLQGLLLHRHSRLQFALLEMIGCRTHHGRSLLETLHELRDTRVVLDRRTRSHSLRECARLRCELGLQFGQHPCAFLELPSRARGVLLTAQQIPGGQQNLPLPFGNRALLIAHRSATAAALPFAEATFERLDLHHEQIRLHAVLTILRDGVVAHQISRLQRMILIRRSFHLLQTQERLNVGLARTRVERHRTPFTAVHRVAKGQLLQFEVVLRTNRDGHFLDAARLPITARPADLDAGLGVFNDLDGIVIRECDPFVRDFRADAIGAGRAQLDRARSAGAIGLHLRRVLADGDDRGLERRVRHYFHIDSRALHGPNTTTDVLDVIGQRGPLRIAIGESHALDARQIGDRNVVMCAGLLQATRARDDVVLQRVTHREQFELPGVRILIDDLHGRAFPLRSAIETHPDLCALGLESRDRGLNGEIAVAADSDIARFDLHFTQRHRIARQCAAEQQVPACVTPVGGSTHEQKEQCADACGSGNGAGPQFRIGNDPVRRCVNLRKRIAREQLGHCAVRATATTFVEKGLNAALLTRQASFDLALRVSPQSSQRQIDQRCTHGQREHEQCNATRHCNARRIVLLAQQPDGEQHDGDAAQRPDGSGTQQEHRAQSSQQRVQIVVESFA